jgi:hypothetical protein
VTFNSAYNTALGGLAIFGELAQGQPTPTPGGPPPPPGAIVPTLSGYMLALFAFLLAVCAVVAIYRR